LVISDKVEKHFLHKKNLIVTITVIIIRFKKYSVSGGGVIVFYKEFGLLLQCEFKVNILLTKIFFAFFYK
jgi:hypothetical protein